MFNNAYLTESGMVCIVDRLSRRDWCTGLVLLPFAGCLGSPNEGDSGSPEADPGDDVADNASGIESEPEPLAEPLPALTEADDPSRFADEHDLEYRDGAVRVVVHLEPSADSPSAVTVEYRRDGRLFGFVPIDDLRAVAMDDRVQFVRPPADPEPVGE